MSRITLNDRFLENASSKVAQIDYFDALCPGLAIRVSKTGRKVWTFTYTSCRDGKRAKIKLGTYPATSLKAARAKAETARGQVEAGIDPRDVVAVQKPKTIAELVEERLNMEVRAVKDEKTGLIKREAFRTVDQFEQRYAKYIVEPVGRIAVKDFLIDPHYNSIIDPLLKRGKNRTANVVHQDITTLFNFAIRRGVIEYSRLAKIGPPTECQPRKRFLSQKEIVAMWHGLPTAIYSSQVQRIVKLLLVTGQRLGEVTGVSRQELDLQKRIWTIPSTRAKNGYEHQVPLSDLAFDLFKTAMQETNSDFLFPTRAGNRPLFTKSVDNTVRYAQASSANKPLGKFGVAVWRPHDLRRTVATQMLNKENKLAIPSADVSHVLNHRTQTKVTITQLIYDQNLYLEEKREALDKWGAFLAKLVGEDVGEREAA